jgi:hypothetical protein
VDQDDIKIDARDLLNAQTAKIDWEELQRHFARGVVIKVAPQLDLINVAGRLIDDDKTTFEAWLASGQVARATDDDARAWVKSQPSFWAVVVAPWVLVQPIQDD